jgi:Na+-translocating ferredoxin:NAD+ oxidoreductase RnfD subunit
VSVPAGRRGRRRPARRPFRFLGTPKGMTLVALAGLALLAGRHEGPTALPETLAAVLTATAADLALARWLDGRWRLPDGAAVTGLIVAMVLSAHEPWYVSATTALLAVVSKHVFRTRWSNVFNPAACGLVASYFLFGAGQSWWGALADLGPAWVLLLLAVGLFIAQRVNKLTAVLVFLGATIAVFTAEAFAGNAARVAETFRAPDIEAMLFFACLMLTDPPTSPARPRDQVPYALVVAAAACAAFLAWGALWFLPGGLLVGNAWETARRLLAAPRAGRRPAPAAR